MAIVNRSTAKTYFNTGDKPTESEFSDFIDSAIFQEDFSNFGKSLVSAQTATSVRNILDSGTIGDILFRDTTQVSAQNNIGGGTVGKNVFTATTTASAQQNIGGGTVGRQIFEATTTASATNIVNQTATSTSQGILALTPNKIITLSNNATDATNDIDATTGWFNFDDGSGQAYYSGGTGQLDVLFSAGGNGMLDAGTIANTTYHIFLIHNPTTLVSKILASTSVSSPTMPSGYTKKARIGSIIRASGAILAFEQFDKKFILGGTKIVDRAIAAPPTTASNQTVTAPAGISTRAVSLIECEPNSANGNTFLIIEPTTHTSTTPTSTNHTLFVWHQSGGPISLSTQIETKTNTSSQILINANISTSHNLRIIAIGWIDYQLNY